MPVSTANFLKHILDEASYLAEIAAKTSYDVFIHDETLKRSFVRSIEIIGEASKKIPQQVRDLEPKINWRNMSRMRDKLIHAYFSVDHQIVWLVAQEKAPELKALLPDLIKQVIALEL